MPSCVAYFGRVVAVLFRNLASEHQVELGKLKAPGLVGAPEHRAKRSVRRRPSERNGRGYAARLLRLCR